MYPYVLGIQFGTGRLVRLLRHDLDPYKPNLPKIPQGYGKILRLRSCLMIRNKLHCSGPKLPPYEDGQLDMRYWSLNRNTDLVHK